MIAPLEDAPDSDRSLSSRVSVQLDPQNRIVVELGREHHTGDSYYLGIAPSSQDHDCTPAEGLRRLLDAWIRELTAEGSDLVYLPFDFSDEYTRWLACQKIGTDLLVVSGTASVEGWAITPSDFSDFATSLPQFAPDEPLVVQQFYLPRFLSQLRRSLAALSCMQ